MPSTHHKPVLPPQVLGISHFIGMKHIIPLLQEPLQRYISVEDVVLAMKNDE
jgi:hypothetical protein